MKKKIFGILLTLVLAVTGFGLVGCGGGNNPAPGPGPEPAPEVSYDDDTTPVAIDETGLLFDLWTTEEMEEDGWDEEYITDYNQACVYAVTEEVVDLVIPAYVTDGENTYRVTCVENLLFTIDTIDDNNDIWAYTGVNELASGIKTITIPSTVDNFHGVAGWFEYQDPADENVWISEPYYLENLESIILNNRTEAIDIIGGIWQMCNAIIEITYPDGDASDEDVCAIEEEVMQKLLNYDEENDLYYLGNPSNPYMVLVLAGNTYFPEEELGEDEELVVSINENCKVIGEHTFENTCVTGVVLPDVLVTIGNHAFCSCEALESVILPNGLVTIGNYAFDSCKALESVILPNGLVTIGEGAFCSCEALESVILPEGLESIGEFAFYGCDNLEELVIPSTVKKLSFNCINTFYTNVLINSAELIENDLIYNFEVFYVLTEVCDDAIIGDSEDVHFEKTDSEVDGYNCYVFIDPFIR